MVPIVFLAPRIVSGPWEVLSKFCLMRCLHVGKMLPLSHLFLCVQATKGGTIKAASGFNATEDAQTLRKAMKGLGKCSGSQSHSVLGPLPTVNRSHSKNTQWEPVGSSGQIRDGRVLIINFTIKIFKFNFLILSFPNYLNLFFYYSILNLYINI